MGLTKGDIDAIYALASRLTGTEQSGSFRHEVLVSNVERRMSEWGVKNFPSYLKLVKSSGAHFETLISDLTIHTTSWFRELPHFKLISEKITEDLKNSPTSKKIKIWSAAASTGEEVYSLALLMEELRHKFGVQLDYSIYGTDIDPVSIKTAEKCIYKKTDLISIPNEYKKFLLLGTGKVDKFFVLSKEIRRRCQFGVFNLIGSNSPPFDEKFDFIFCRNVLIYFNYENQQQILERLAKKLNVGGILVMGHCDSLPTQPMLAPMGKSSFVRIESRAEGLIKSNHNRKKALIVDDSKLIRKLVSKILQTDFQIFEAETSEEASRILGENKIDFISLDLNMPGKSGAEWLTQLRNKNDQTPVVILSDSSAKDAQKIFGALLGGAQEYITKSRLNDQKEYLLEIALSLTKDSECTTRPANLKKFKSEKFSPKLIMIGSSTGGPEALNQLLSNLPEGLPPIILVQHISHEFANPFADRIQKASSLQTKVITNETRLVGSTIYLSGGDFHLQVIKKEHQLFLVPNFGEKILGIRPSIDVLFKSAASLQDDTISIILTGMGQDGSEGLSKLSETGHCFAMAQDAESSIVFGMPKKAIETGAVSFVGNINQIRNELLIRAGSHN